MLGLNVGSGQRPFKSVPNVIEWVNVDKVERQGMPKPDLICDATTLPYRDETVDYFALHHVLEHFGCNEGIGLLREAHRVLKSGGFLQVFVPDLRSLAERWTCGGINTQIFLTNVYGAYMGSEEDRHRWGFDRESLWSFLSQVPWGTRSNSCHSVPGSDYARDWWILEMECRK